MDVQIELPHPTEEARARIMQIHSRKMNVDMEGALRCPLDGHERTVWVCGHSLTSRIVCASLSIPLLSRADTNFDELARSTDDFNGAQLKAVRGPLGN